VGNLFCSYKPLSVLQHRGRLILIAKQRLFSAFCELLAIMLIDISFKFTYNSVRKEDDDMSKPIYLANNFIQKALQEDISLSPMKLQKLIYFVYRDYLQKTEKPLFAERIGTWEHGPVVGSVYQEFKGYGRKSIKKFARNGSGDVRVLNEKDKQFGEVLNNVWNKYKHYSGSELSRITHQEGSAWSQARKEDVGYLRDEDILDDRAG